MQTRIRLDMWEIRMTNKNSWLITGVGSDKELFQIVLFPKKDSSICE